MILHKDFPATPEFLGAAYEWRGETPWTAAELMTAADLLGGALLDAVPKYLCPSAKSLGRYLSTIVDQPSKGFVVTRHRAGSGRATQWKIEKLGDYVPPPPDPDPQIDWSARADGKPHFLIRGEHYNREASKVRHAATVWGHRHKLRARTQLTDAGILIRFVPFQGKV